MTDKYLCTRVLPEPTAFASLKIVVASKVIAVGSHGCVGIVNGLNAHKTTVNVVDDTPPMPPVAPLRVTRAPNMTV